MCHRVTCRRCGKATYAGCGQHVESVLRGVPDRERCTCAPAPWDPARNLVARLLGR
jgi:hypothetical protein